MREFGHLVIPDHTRLTADKHREFDFVTLRFSLSLLGRIDGVQRENFDLIFGIGFGDLL